MKAYVAVNSVSQRLKRVRLDSGISGTSATCCSGSQQRYAAHGGKTTNIHDLTGLVARLKKLEPELRKAEEDMKSERKAVAKRGYKPKRKPSASAS